MKRLLPVVGLLLALAAHAGAQAVIVPSPVPSCSNGDVLSWDAGAANFECVSVGAASQPFDDSLGLIANNADPTKILKFDVSAIATGTTRTVTWPNAAVTIPSTVASLGANTFTALQTANGGIASTTGTFSSTVSIAGATTLNTVAYTWPGSQGGASTVLTNDGAGVLSWASPSASLPNPITQDLLFTDATYDIGASGATRPRDLFLSRNATIGGTLGVTGASTIAALSATSGAFSTTLSVTGASTLAAVGASSLTVSGITVLTGNLTLSGTGNAVGTITSGVWNAGAVTSSGGISGTTGAFSGDFAVATNKFTVASASGNTVVAGTLGVTGALTPSALVNISGASAGQIQFPASQNASAGTNTLDDYEEGVWTPVIGGSTSETGQSYTTQTATYTKIGRNVAVTAIVELSNKGTITGNLQIKGLPFAVSGNGSVPVMWGNLANTMVYVVGELSGSVINIYGIAAAATSSATHLTTADVTNTTWFEISVSYNAS